MGPTGATFLSDQHAPPEQSVRGFFSEPNQQCTAPDYGSRPLSPANSRATSMRSITTFAERYPIAYLAGCCVLGLAIRWFMAGGDMGRFIDPLYPLIHR
jgi:hypothetical protein